MSWQDDLQKKAEAIKLTKEATHVSTGNSNRGSIGSDNRRSGNGDISVSNGKTTIKERTKAMIKVEDALSDLEQYIEEAPDVNAKAILKGLKVVVKFLSTMRSNQLLTESEKTRLQTEKNARIVENKSVKK